MSIRINSALVPPFAVFSEGGNDFVINTRGKHRVKLTRNGDDVTIKEVATVS